MRGRASVSAKKDSSRVADMRRRREGAWSSERRERRKKASSEGDEVKVVLMATLLRSLYR